MKKKKVLLIGWDGADWEHINPLMDKGLLPTLNEFVDQGTIGNLATLQPVLSPMLWNSVATGKFADKHGIHGFVEPDPKIGGARPFSSVSRKTKAIWNIFSQNGIRSNVINWWASHPAEQINGVVSTNLFNGVKFEPGKGWAITPGTIHPKELEKEYARLKFSPHEMGHDHILPFIPDAANIDQENDTRLSSFSKTFAEMMTTHSIATAVMERHPWEFMAVYFTGIDHFAHGFMQYHPPKMNGISDEDFEMYKDVVVGAYRFHDMMLERYLQLAGEDTTVILCSDHGFQSGAFRPLGTPREPAGPAVWHRQYGILAMKGEGIKKDERIYGSSLIDIGPTLLHLMGLPVGDDMDGRPLIEAFEEPAEVKTIPSWDDVDGDHGMHSGEESMGGVDSEELLKQFIALGYIEDDGDDKEKQAESAEIENKYNLARCLMWQERHDEALVLLEEILLQSPWETRFIIHTADCYRKCGYLQQSIRLLEKSFNLDETIRHQAIVVYAKAHLELGNLEKGLEYLELAASRTPRHPNTVNEIGDVFTKQRRWDQAEKAYKRAIALHTEFARGWQGLAKVYLRTGRNQEAADAALKAVNLLFRLPQAHLCLGIALARSKEYESAIIAFRNAIQFAPKLGSAHRWLAILYEQGGNTSAADSHRKRHMMLANFRTDEKKTESERRERLFDLPEIESEKERGARTIKERPRPSDPVEKSGKTFVLVSGLPRSGTSLMMQMLVAGGMDVITDGIREADKDNPKGYFEWEDIKKIGEQPELLDNEKYNGRAVKAVSMLLEKMPKEHDYKVIFMMRPIQEIAHSQEKMIERLGTEGADLEFDELQRGLRNHRGQVISWFRSAKHMDVLKVRFPDLIESPANEIVRLIEFLGDEFITSPDKIQATIDGSLYRNRTNVT